MVLQLRAKEPQGLIPHVGNNPEKLSAITEEPFERRLISSSSTDGGPYHDFYIKSETYNSRS